MKFPQSLIFLINITDGRYAHLEFCTRETFPRFFSNVSNTDGANLKERRARMIHREIMSRCGIWRLRFGRISRFLGHARLPASARNAHVAKGEPRHGSESPGRIQRSFVCGVDLSAWKCVFPRVTWPLRLAHKGQRQRRPLLSRSLPAVRAATAYAKRESLPEGSLWHGTPWGTGALVSWTKHLPESPPSY